MQSADTRIAFHDISEHFANKHSTGKTDDTGHPEKQFQAFRTLAHCMQKRRASPPNQE